MIDDSLFSPDAPMHQPVRFSHDGCSDGKDACLIITRIETGWLWHCHRCKKRGYKGLQGLTISETSRFVRASAQEHKPVVDEEVLLLPKDSLSIPNMPRHALAYLFRYILVDDIVAHGVVYSPSLNRVVFPIYADGRLVCWQGRYLGTPDKYNPKWLTQRIRSSKHNYYKVVDKVVNNTTVVLVEDIPSALVVGRSIHAWAVLGTYIPDELIMSIPYKHVILWFDCDAINQSLKYSRRFHMFGIKCDIIHTEKDPKEYGKDDVDHRLGFVV